MKITQLLTIACLVSCCFHINFVRADATYEKEIAPVLTKYCGGCHNDDEASGKLSLETFSKLQAGGESGPLLIPGDSQASRIIRVLTGKTEPSMPPEDEPQPTEKEIAKLRAWIEAGAKGPTGESLEVKTLITPELAPSLSAKPITSLAYSPAGKFLAVARFKNIEIRTADGSGLVALLSGHPGKVNDVAFSVDGKLLFAATGVTGLRGQVTVWDVARTKVVREITGHGDMIYAVEPSPNGLLVASAGYDRSIVLSDIKTGEKVRSLAGHNGAIYDLAFSPDGKTLASASADATVKVWDVASGERLDTLSQPLKEQFSVDLSPDGKNIFACGEDNRIRKWQLVSIGEAKINPILISRFGHEQAVERLRISNDGRYAVSVSADRSLKIWDAETLTEQRAFNGQTDSVQALAIHPNSQSLAIGRMDGSLEVLAMKLPNQLASRQETETPGLKPVAAARSFEMSESVDTEPNDQAKSAQQVNAPTKITGVIDSQSPDRSDVDMYRFTSKAGQEWVVEVNAARNKSPLDSHLAIYDSKGNPVPRVLLQAIRDSYFTFRGKDSKQTGDFRVHNWREMRLNQFLYASGEVVKLFHYPRGPDSGFNVYPNFGNRHTYFGTSGMSHALGEPCYIVEPHAPGAEITPNGLPVFEINYENDDESSRRLGSDSKLMFTAPADGEYVVAIRDVRDFSGDEYKYELAIRAPKPDFKVKLSGKDPKVAPGTGRRFTIELERIDDFDGEVRIEVDGLPSGFSVTNPIVVEADHLKAFGAVIAAEDAEKPDGDASLRVTAIAMVNGQEVVKEIDSLGKVTLLDPPPVRPTMIPDNSSDANVLEVIPGQTVTATLKITRNNFKARVSFGKEDAVWNSPHGVYVDNIGLNGVLMPEETTERQIFVTAEPWVKPTERWVFVEAGVKDNPTCVPVLLRVIPSPDIANR